MIYLSSKEVAKKWGITPTRVVVLAKQGRIEGARLMGKSWIIPDTSPKPLPPAKRGQGFPKPKDTRLHYPYLLASAIADESFLYWLTDEEKILLDAQKAFAELKFDEATPVLIDLLATTRELNIKIGSLYCLAMIALFKNDFNKYEQYTFQMQAIFAQPFEYRQEMLPVLTDLMSYTQGCGAYKNFNYIPADKQLDAQALPFIAVCVASSNLLNMYQTKRCGDTAMLEVLCRQYESIDCVYTACYLHITLALMYNYVGNRSASGVHIQQGVKLAYQYGFKAIPVLTYQYCPDIFDEVLSTYPEEYANSIREANKQYVQINMNTAEQMLKDSKYTKLSSADFQYIMYAVNGYNNSRTAEIFGVSPSYVTKKYNQLCNLLNAEDKKELVEKVEALISGDEELSR